MYNKELIEKVSNIIKTYIHNKDPFWLLYYALHNEVSEEIIKEIFSSEEFEEQACLWAYDNGWKDPDGN